MKNLIREILKEEREKSLTPQFDFIRKVARMVAYNDIELDYSEETLTLPFISPMGQKVYMGDIDWGISYKKPYLETREMGIYLKQMYGLDIVHKEGLLRGFYRIMREHLMERVKNERSNLREQSEKKTDLKLLHSTNAEEFKYPNLLPNLIKFLDKIITIEMVEPSYERDYVYDVYLYDHPTIKKHYCWGCSGIYHYPTANNDLHELSHIEDNDQFTSAVELSIKETFGFPDDSMDFYYVVNDYLFGKVKEFMDNDPSYDYPDKHNMDW